MAKSRLHELSEHGQSVWIDSLSRQWLRDGTMRKLIGVVKESLGGLNDLPPSSFN